MLKRSLWLFSAISFLCASTSNADPGLARRVVTRDHRPASTPDFVDAKHTYMVNELGGIFTQADADAMDEAAVDDFEDKYGFDLDCGEPGIFCDPNTGVRSNGIVTMIPYVLGKTKTQRVVDDTAHPIRGLLANWYVIEVAALFIFNSSGTITNTSAENYGATYQPLMNHAYGKFVFLREGGNPQFTFNREIMDFNSYQLGLVPVNMWGAQEFLISLNVFQNGKKGLGISATMNLREPESTGTPTIELRNIYEWYN